MSEPPIDLIFCMAGRYQRFRDAGYVTPKYLLPWAGRTVLHLVAADMLRSGAFSRCLFVANQRDRAHADTMLDALRPLGVGRDDLIFIGDTDGQAATAALGLEHLGPAGAVAFHNVDTVLLGRDWPAATRRLAICDGLIDTFRCDDPAFSYVALDDDGYVTDIREKEVISPHATSGFYAFADGDAFLAAARAEGGRRSAGESYISDVYAGMLATGSRLAITSHDAAETLVFGTPAQYEALVAAAAAGDVPDGARP